MFLFRYLKRGYEYLFYKLYISIEKYSYPVFLSEWKASLILDLSILCFLYSLIIYYQVFIDRYSSLGGRFEVIIFILLVECIISYFVFHRKNRWKKLVKDFNKLSKKKNKLGTIICGFIIIFFFFSLVYAFYLMSKINWELYK